MGWDSMYDISNNYIIHLPDSWIDHRLNRSITDQIDPSKLIEGWSIDASRVIDQLNLVEQLIEG